MALIDFFGGEFAALEDGWFKSQTTVTFNTSYYRTGAYSIKLAYTNSGNFFNSIVKNLTTAKSTLYIQFAAYLRDSVSHSANWQMFKWKSGTVTLGGILFNNTSKSLDVYTGDFATKVITGTTALGANQWYLIEIYIDIADSGTLTLRIDGIQEGTFSGDTKPGSETTMSALQWGQPNAISSDRSLYLDDIVINDTSGTLNNSWPGGLKVARLAPTADASPNEFEPSTGTDHYAVVDEIPPSSSDYLTGDADAEQEKFTMADLPSEAASVAGVKALVWGQRTAEANPDRIHLGVESGGTDYLSSELEVPNMSNPVAYLMETDPDTSLSWTPAGVNAAKFLMEASD